MDWLAGLGLGRIHPVVGFVWMFAPTALLLQALADILRRWRLLQHAVAIDATITKVEPGGAPDGLPENTLVDLAVIYRVGDRAFDHRLTRTDHAQRPYAVGGAVRLLYEEGRPGNVHDAESHPWHDVIGPVVLGFLLFVFMAWLLLFLVGLF